MKALVYTGPKQVVVNEVSVPEPKAGQVRVKVDYCGVGGSETGIFLGTLPRA